MSKEFVPTIKELEEMNLTEKQICQLLEYENDKHGFHTYLKPGIKIFRPPHSIFFLDIKDTLYHAKGHGNIGLLGRAGDSHPISMYDIATLFNLLKEQLKSTYATLDTYHFTDVGKGNLVYNFPEDEKTAKYILDLPSKDSIACPLNFFHTFDNNHGPYKIVFVSSDPVEVQKNIICFLCIMSDFNLSYFGYIGNKEVTELALLFEKCNYDIERFVKEASLKYNKDFSLGFKKSSIDEIMNATTFLSTYGTKRNKVQLMQDFLEKHNKEYNLTYDDYNVFACGDLESQDGPMVKYALQLGGYGCLNTNNLAYHTKDTENMRKELYLEFGIETRLPLVSYGINDFYNKAMDFLSVQRTWDIAETMRDINDPGIQKVKNRFYKTNHYIEIKK